MPNRHSWGKVIVSFINGFHRPHNEQEQHEIIQNQNCESVEVGHSGLMHLTPSRNVQIGVNAQATGNIGQRSRAKSARTVISRAVISRALRS